VEDFEIPQWEYKIVSGTLTDLNSWGLGGWEIIHLFGTNHQIDPEYHVMIKKPIGLTNVVG
jgi:hypothetical protein